VQSLVQSSVAVDLPGLAPPFSSLVSYQEITAWTPPPSSRHPSHRDTAKEQDAIARMVGPQFIKTLFVAVFSGALMVSVPY
jgi:hypothetical protein